MSTLNLTSQARSALRAAAHPLRPIVWIGDKGLTDAVLKEIDVMLNAHGLIKVRVAGHEREARETMLTAICAQLSCAAVHHLGKTLILHRPDPAKEDTVTRAVRKPSEPYTPKKLAAAGKTPVRKTRKRQDGDSAAKAVKPAARPAKSSTRSALSLRAGIRRGVKR